MTTLFCTSLTINCSFLSHSSSSASQSHCFGFSRVHSLLAIAPNAAPRLSLTRPRSASRLRIAEFAMAESDSSCIYSEYAEIVVVRHGETEWNACGRIQGHLDVELNEAGRQQAAAVADRLSKEAKISFIYSSDLKRALETAEIIATHCGQLEVIKDPSLRERNLGDLQGLVLRDAAKSCPEAHEALMSRRTDLEIPGGGESRDQLSQRCVSAMKKIGRMHIGVEKTNTTPSFRYLQAWTCRKTTYQDRFHEN